MNRKPSLWRRRSRSKQDKVKSRCQVHRCEDPTSTTSSCHKAKRSISKSTRRSCAREDESCGRTNFGCFTTTMHLLTTPTTSERSQPRGTSLYWNNHPIHRSFSFPQVQGYLQGDLFLRRGGHKESHNDATEGHPKRILSVVHRQMVEKNDKVH